MRRTPEEEHPQGKKGVKNKCTSSHYSKAGVQSLSYKSHNYNVEQQKHVCKSILDTSFPKDGYMCPNNSLATIAAFHDITAKRSSERETNQGYEAEIEKHTTHNMIAGKECDKRQIDNSKICQCRQSVSVSEQFATKLPQCILKEKNTTETADKSQVEKSMAFQQFHSMDKTNVETNTEPGIPFRNTPNTAVISVKVQQTSTRTEEKEILARHNLQKTLQRQELPSVNIRPELSIQSGPTIHISAKSSKNVKQLRKNVDVTNIICDEENINLTKQAVNDEGNKFLLKNKTKQLEESENLKSYVKVKSTSQMPENLLSKHAKFKHFIHTFSAELQKENSRIQKNQSKKLLQTLQSLSSNVNELYATFQYAIPSYQECIMTRIDRVTQLLEYELQDENSVTEEHCCRLDEFFQQLTKSFQQEQCRRLWQKNVTLPPQDFVTFKSSLESVSNLGRQKQNNDTARPFQRKTTAQSVTNLNRSKQIRKQGGFILNDKTGEHLHYKNSANNSENKRTNTLKNTEKTTDFSSASRSHVSKQVSFGKNVQRLVTNSSKQLVSRNVVKKDSIQSAQEITKESVSVSINDNMLEVNIDHKPIRECISDKAGSWQAERMKVIQKIHAQLSEIELQFDSDNKSKSVTDSAPVNIRTQSSTNVEAGHSRSNGERDSEIKTAEMDTTQNQSQMNQADEDVEAEYADDWEVDDDDDDDDDEAVVDVNDEDNSSKTNEDSGKWNNSDDDGNIGNDHNDDEDDDDNNNNGYEDDIIEEDYGKSEVLQANEGYCEDLVPSLVTSISVSVKKSQEDKEDLDKRNSDGTRGPTECETTSDNSSVVPVKSTVDTNKVACNNKISDTNRDCASTESLVMKETEIFKRNEICTQTDIQNGYSYRNTGIHTGVDDSKNEPFKSVDREQKKLFIEHEGNKIFCISANDKSGMECDNSSRPHDVNIERLEKCTQTKTECSHNLPMQSVIPDSAENVYEVSIPDCQAENAIILKTKGKSQNIQFVVNLPTEIAGKQVQHSRQFISEKDNIKDNNLATLETNFQGASSITVSNLLGIQKSDLIKDLIEPTIEQVLKKYNESTASTYLLRNESLHTNREAEYRTAKSAEEDLHNRRRQNSFDLTVPNVSLQTNSAFWSKLREVADVLTNATSQHADASEDNKIIESSYKTEVKTGLQGIQIDTKETVGNDTVYNSQKPDYAYKTVENNKEHDTLEPKHTTNLTFKKQDFMLSSSSSVASTSSTSSSLYVMKKQKFYRTNKNSENPAVSFSDGEICLTSSMCSCSVGEVKSLYCQYCRSIKNDMSQSEDLSVGELKRKSAINRNKKYYYGRKVIRNGDCIQSAKTDTGNGYMSLIRESISQGHLTTASTDDTSSASEGEIKYSPEVVTLAEPVEAGSQMKPQFGDFPDYLSLHQGIHLNDRVLDYGSVGRNKCSIKTLNSEHGKNKETKNGVSTVDREIIFKYASRPQTNIQGNNKSTSKSFADVANSIIEELKKEKISSFEKYKSMKSDAGFKNTGTEKGMMDTRQLNKLENPLQNLKLSFGVLTHDITIPLDVKEMLYSAENMGNSASEFVTDGNSMKEYLKFQDDEDCASNSIGEIYADNEALKDRENFSTSEEFIHISNFQATNDNNVVKQHADLSVVRTTNIEGNLNNSKTLSIVAKEPLTQECNVKRTDNIRNCTPIEYTIGERHIQNKEQAVKFLETMTPNSSALVDDMQQVPLQIVTEKSDHLVIKFENVNTSIEVFTEGKDMSEPSTVGSFKDSSSSVSYGDLPGVYEIDFETESKSSGELLPGTAAALDTMYYTECESDSSRDGDKDEEQPTV